MRASFTYTRIAQTQRSIETFTAIHMWQGSDNRRCHVPSRGNEGEPPWPPIPDTPPLPPIPDTPPLPPIPDTPPLDE